MQRLGGSRPDSALYWEFHAEEAIAAHARRRDFIGFLRQHGTAESDYQAAEIIFGELVANVIRHAPGPITVRVEWRTGLPTLLVVDKGRGFSWNPVLPRDPLDESQRGLFIVQTLSADVHVAQMSGGGSGVTAVLPVVRRGGVSIR